MKLACHAVNLVDPVDVVDLDDPDVWQGERRVEPAVGVHHSVGHSLVIIITIMSIIIIIVIIIIVIMIMSIIMWFSKNHFTSTMQSIGSPQYIPIDTDDNSIIMTITQHKFFDN